jgi:hypothetical protein
MTRLSALLWSAATLAGVAAGLAVLGPMLIDWLR